MIRVLGYMAIRRYIANAVVAHTVVSVCFDAYSRCIRLAAAVQCAYIYSLRVHVCLLYMRNLTAP
jgi:hypothetical protein